MKIPRWEAREGGWKKFVAPPCFEFSMSEERGEWALSMIFERLRGKEIDWFIEHLQRHPGLIREVDMEAVVDRPYSRFRIKFAKEVKTSKDIPEFIKVFSGMVEGEIEAPSPPMTIWERLRVHRTDGTV